MASLFCSSRQLCALLLGTAGLVGLPACGDQELPPRGQILLYVTTDAVLPPPPGASVLPQEPAALFDRMRIEVFAPEDFADPCEGCVREFAVDREQVAAGLASVGIVPPFGIQGYRARVRLFVARFLSRGEPLAGTALDTTVALPAVASEGIVDCHVILKVDDLGVQKGTPENPVEAALGTPPLGLVGSWPGSARTPCEGAPLAKPGAPGETLDACVPGGAFWMGNPLTVGSADDPGVPLPRLVVLSPFYLDKSEVSVALLRASGAAEPDDPREWSGSAQGESYAGWCTYSSTPDRLGPGTDSLPVNCLSRNLAQKYCSSRPGGGTLPSEAQLEYAAGDLAGRLYVWGEDEPTCADSVWGRGGIGVLASSPRYCADAERQGYAGPPGGVSLPGTGERDVLPSSGERILDLSGNLSEIARDQWQRWSESCWSLESNQQSRILRDPVCKEESPKDGDQWVLRGGSWLRGTYALRAGHREGVTPEAASKFYGAMIGTRCARNR